MSDKLKQFIDENREAFDGAAPQPKSWDALEQKINTGRHQKKIGAFSFRKPMAWAASFAGLVIISATIYISQQRNQKNDITLSPDGDQHETTDIIDPILDPIQARQITQFEEIIELKQSELKLLEKEEPELYREFISDINSLDSAYASLKTTLQDNPNRELLLEAMLNNLQLQSDLLSRQLKIIKEIKQQKKYRHEKQVS